MSTPPTVASAPQHAPPGAERAPERPGRLGGGAARAWALLVMLAALLPSVGTLSAPPISDDAAALAYVWREPALVDWRQPQYGMRVVRFWRPLVTTSLDLEVALSGVRPAPLRLFNLAGHAAAALLAGLLALRLGGGRRGALVAGLLAASFPDHGGTVTWIVGRVDSLTVPLVLLAAWLSLGGRVGSPRAWLGASLAAGAVAFLACASKELAFVLPAFGFALALGRGDGARAAARAALPLALGAGAAFLARRVALGTWVGGYPSPAFGAGGLVQAAGVLLRVFWPVLAAGGLALALARPARAALRAGLGALIAALLAVGPLYAFLADGLLEEQNRRILFLTDTALAIAVGAALGGARSRARWLQLAPLVPLIVARMVFASSDAREWAEAGRVAEAHVARAREALREVAPAPEPVFDASMPASYEGAYCLAWGVADRFRPPFEAAPRPVWPLRVLFVQHTAGEREQSPVVAPRASLVDPFGATPRLVPELLVTVEGRSDSGPLPIDAEVATPGAGGAVLEVWGAQEGTLVFVAYTELGYEPAEWLGAPPAEPAALPNGSEGRASSVRRISLGDVLRLGSPVSLGAALIQAADAGSTRAYLEVRLVAASAAPHERPIAASRMIALEWERDILKNR